MQRDRSWSKFIFLGFSPKMELEHGNKFIKAHRAHAEGPKLLDLQEERGGRELWYLDVIFAEMPSQITGSNITTIYSLTV